MRKLAAVLIVLTTITSALAQSDEIKVEYDRFKDKTFVSTPIMMIAGIVRNGLGMSISTGYDGKVIVRPATVVLAIFSSSPSRVLYDDRELIFLLDGERLKLGQMQKAGTRYHSEVLTETSGLEIPFETAVKIANSKVVEGKIGPREFKIDDSNLSKIRRFVRYFEEVNSK